MRYVYTSVLPDSDLSCYFTSFIFLSSSSAYFKAVSIIFTQLFDSCNPKSHKESMTGTENKNAKRLNFVSISRGNFIFLQTTFAEETNKDMKTLLLSSRACVAIFGAAQFINSLFGPSALPFLYKSSSPFDPIPIDPIFTRCKYMIFNFFVRSCSSQIASCVHSPHSALIDLRKLFPLCISRRSSHSTLIWIANSHDGRFVCSRNAILAVLANACGSVQSSFNLLICT